PVEPKGPGSDRFGPGPRAEPSSPPEPPTGSDGRSSFTRDWKTTSIRFAAIASSILRRLSLKRRVKASPRYESTTLLRSERLSAASIALFPPPTTRICSPSYLRGEQRRGCAAPRSAPRQAHPRERSS